MTARVIGPNIQWLKAVPLLILTGLLTILALGALTGAHSTQAPARNALFDFFQRLSPADHDPSENFHIIAIDEASLAKAGPWPWPRTVLAEIVETAAAAGAKAVILAEPMDTPDPLSPETIGEFWLEGASDDALAQQLARLPRTNQVLARSFSGVDGAIAVSLNALSSEINAAPLSRVSADTAPWLTFEGARAGFVALPIAIAQYPVDPDLMASAEPAIASLTPYPDGLIRSATILWSWNDAPTPSLALKAAFLALGETALTASADPTSAASEGSLIRTMQITDTALAIDPAQQFRLHLPKRIQTPATSAARFLGGAGSNRQVEGAVVIIGRASDLGPTLQTSRGPVSPAEMHSLIASQIAAGISLQRPQWTGYAEALATMLLGAAAIMFAQRLQFWQAAAFASALAILLIVGAFTAFASADLLLDPLPAAAALFVGALSVAGGRSLGGALRDDSVRGAFQDSLPNPALKDLASQGARAFDGVKRDITVLACELRFADEDIEALGDSPDEAVKVLAAA
ncbi:MAG: CHASE2 domain-containing protein, partial [Pseudomonadota bacterium]